MVPVPQIPVADSGGALLSYYCARYYDPAVGRFLSEDPGEFGGADVNFYRYVHNSSPYWVDPFGLNSAAPAIPWPRLLPRPRAWPWAGPIGVAIGLFGGDVVWPDATSSDDVLRKDPLDCDRKDRCKKQFANDLLWCEFMFEHDLATMEACYALADENLERCLNGEPRVNPDPRIKPTPGTPDKPRKPEPPIRFPKR
jgi:RHS repeat-associated protein